MKRTVLDSYALIAYLERQEGAEQVARAFDQCVATDREVLVCVVNWGEVFYHSLRVGGEAAAQLALDAMRALPIELREANKELTLLAAQFKAHNKMSYADCFAAALAKKEKAELLTGDKQFKQVENEVEIRWI